MSTILVSPLDETVRPRREPAERLTSLDGATVGLLDISKPGGSVFLDRLEQRLVDDHGVKHVVRDAKPTFAKPAPEDVINRLRQTGVEAVIEALAD